MLVETNSYNIGRLYCEQIFSVYSGNVDIFQLTLLSREIQQQHQTNFSNRYAIRYRMQLLQRY